MGQSPLGAKAPGAQRHNLLTAPDSCLLRRARSSPPQNDKAARPQRGRAATHDQERLLRGEVFKLESIARVEPEIDGELALHAVRLGTDSGDLLIGDLTFGDASRPF